MSKVSELLFSFFIRAKNHKLVLFEVLRANIERNKFKMVFLFNDYHYFSENRSKTYPKGNIHTDRDKLLENFLSHGDFLNIFIVTCDRLSDVSAYKNLNMALIKKFDVVIFCNNVGRDLGAYISGLNWIEASDFSCDYAFLCNSSLCVDDKVIHRALALIESGKMDNHTLGGVGYGFGPRYLFRKFFHIQSYCLFGKLNAVSKFISEAKISQNKFFLIRNGEIRMSKVWLQLKSHRLLVISKSLSLLIVKKNINRFTSFDSRFDELTDAKK